MTTVISTWRDWMIANNEVESMWKEVAMAQYKVLSQRLA
jgi:hypothetical protein